VNLSERIDAAILAVIFVWAVLDRCQVYFRGRK